MRYSTLLSLAALFLLGCGPGNHMDESTITTTTETNLLYYGDITGNAVITLDLTLMQPVNSIDSNGFYPYEVANALDGELYVLNRKDTVIGVLDPLSDTITNEIPLSFSPRSISVNGTEILLTSTDAPAAATITDHTASATYSDSLYTEPLSYGGTNATGHPVWVDDNYFLLLDRTENTLELYLKGQHTPVDKLTTQSSVHHVISRAGIFYGICEGIQNGVSPGVVKFTVSNGRITLLQERLLSTLNTLPSDFTAAVWGSHHGAFHPTQDYIYIGSTEGNVFVLDLATLSLADTFKAGKGIGHFTFYNNLMITTNHYDTIKTFHDATDPRNHQYLKTLSFGSTIYDGITMQSHTSHIVDNKLYFMFNTDHDSTLYRINLDTLSIEDGVTLLNHYCLMGALVSDSVTTTTGM